MAEIVFFNNVQQLSSFVVSVGGPVVKKVKTVIHFETVKRDVTGRFRAAGKDAETDAF